MHFANSLLVLGATLSSSSRAIPLDKRDVFTVIQKAAAPLVQSGPASLAKALGKYGAPIPAQLQSAAAGTGTVSATPEANDVEYLSPVSIGGQVLNLDFDTGSSDLWVFSTEQPTTQSAGHSVYNPGQSSTFRRLQGYTWKIQYGDGSGANGDVGTDVVNVGGTSVNGQAVELAQNVSGQFSSAQNINADGLLGLGFSNINTVKPVKQKTFFDNAKPGLALPLFTADLKKGAPGSYDFGFINSAKYKGAITYAPVNPSNGFWQFTVSGYAIGTGAIRRVSIQAIADTGTTLILTDDSIVDAYYAKVRGSFFDSDQGGYVAPCASRFPDFSFVAGGKALKVSGTFINFAPVDQFGTNCFGGIQSNNGLGLTILGDIMFKSKFVIFDSSIPQVGFADKA